jgi:predicted RNase H-like HicB family nuclease
MTKYEVIIYWSKEDKAFIAEVPELPGCYVEQIIAEWIDTAKLQGRPIPKPKGRLIFA